MALLAELVEKRARLTTEMRSWLEKNSAEGNAKFDDINAEVERLDSEIHRIETIEEHERVQAGFAEPRPLQLPDINSRGELLSDTGLALSPRARLVRDPKYAKAFSRYLRAGLGGLDSEMLPMIQAAQTTTTTGGGYLIPQGFSEKLEIALKFFGGIREACYEFTTETGNPLPWPTVNDVTNEGAILGINTQLTEVDFVFGQIMFQAYTHNSNSVLIPLQLMQDSYFDMDALTAQLLGIRLGRGMNHYLTTGTGVNQPNGVVTATVASGNIYTTATGQTTTLIGDDFINLEAQVDPAYWPNAKYMFNSTTLKLAKKLKDSYGRYLWLPGLASKEPNTVNGYPYVLNNHMASPGSGGSPVAGNGFMLFGDFSKYAVRRVSEVSIMRLVERYADYLQVGFQGFLRYDGQLLDAGTHPLAVAVSSLT